MAASAPVPVIRTALNPVHLRAKWWAHGPDLNFARGMVKRELMELHPRTIGIVCIMPDGSTGTQYFNADNRDRTVMCEALQIDSLIELLRVNADVLRAFILGEEDEDETD